MNQNRRLFLKVVGASALSPVVASVHCGGECPSASVGTVSDFPLNSLIGVKGQSIAIGHDADGLYAVTTICTHQGCDMARTGQISNNGFICVVGNCGHGSQYDKNGQVIQGPAVKALNHYALRIADNQVIVDQNTVVSATTRVKTG